MPNQVLDSAQRVTWPYPEHISFKISDENVVTGIPGGDKKSVILVGGNPGLTQIRLVAKKKVYTAQIKVIEPLAVQLCRGIREKFTQLSGSSQLAQAKEFYNRGLSLYEQREEHLKNLYESCQEVRRAWCLLEQMNTKPSIYYLTKALLDKAEKELRDRYRKSDRQAMLFINLRDFWRLKQELEIILDLIPNPQDSRHQRVLAIWDYYAREIDRSAPREVKSRKRR